MTGMERKRWTGVQCGLDEMGGVFAVQRQETDGDKIWTQKNEENAQLI